MLIRRETAGDFPRIHEIVKAAFGSAEHSDGNEHILVEALRSGDAYIPELALVAESGGDIVGHIMFTRLRIGEQVELALAPLSVLPGYQRRGIGSALIREGHKIAAVLGYRYSVVLGSERYYPKFGYSPAKNYGITPPFDVPDENFMVCRLAEDAPDISGPVRYADEFGI